MAHPGSGDAHEGSALRGMARKGAVWTVPATGPLGATEIAWGHLPGTTAASPCPAHLHRAWVLRDVSPPVFVPVDLPGAVCTGTWPVTSHPQQGATGSDRCGEKRADLLSGKQGSRSIGSAAGPGVAVLGSGRLAAGKRCLAAPAVGQPAFES
ncbi:hypothetical protein VTI28DRAFT_8072 [Corynascus sepedonium]